MYLYLCPRCGAKYDYKISGYYRCELCAIPLEYKGEEVSPWGEFEKADN
jgi:DNA-directed RNA polymerase subunit RPC12/RpoP